MLYVQYIAMTVGLWILLYLCAIVHEIGHALVQLMFGQPFDTISVGSPTRHEWTVYGVTIKIGWPFISGRVEGMGYLPKWKLILVYAAGPLFGMIPLYFVLWHYEGLNAVIEVHRRLVAFYFLKLPHVPRGEPLSFFLFNYMLGNVHSRYQVLRLFIVTSWTFNIMQLMMSLPGTDCRVILNLALEKAGVGTKLLVNGISILIMIGPPIYHLYLIYQSLK